jgi:hypothetical protein
VARPEAPVDDSPRIHHHRRPAAAFVAQLVATAQGLPQTRVRRRTSPGEAAALYAAAANITRPRVIKVSL